MTQCASWSLEDRQIQQITSGHHWSIGRRISAKNLNGTGEKIWENQPKSSKILGFFYMLNENILGKINSGDLWCCQSHFQKSPGHGVSIPTPKGLLEKDANPQGVGNNFKASRQQQVTGDGLQRGCKSLWHLLPLTPLFLVAFFKLLGSREWLRTQVGWRNSVHINWSPETVGAQNTWPVWNFEDDRACQ